MKNAHALFFSEITLMFNCIPENVGYIYMWYASEKLSRIFMMTYASQYKERINFLLCLPYKEEKM